MAQLVDTADKLLADAIDANPATPLLVAGPSFERSKTVLLFSVFVAVHLCLFKWS